MEGEFYTVKEFAKLLKTSEQNVRRLIKRGRINAFRLSIGKRAAYRISYDEIGKLQVITYEQIFKGILDGIKEYKPYDPLS